MNKCILLLLFVLFLFECSNNRSVINNQSTESSVQPDTLQYEKIEKGFYRGSDGGLYVKTQSLIKPPEEYVPDFYRQVPNIDIPSFELLCSQGWYAKDKDSVYIVHGMTDGLHIWVLEMLMLLLLNVLITDGGKIKIMFLKTE